MSKLIKIKILSGIPGCGKSTWARSFIAQNPDTKRINRDDLRMMFDDSRFTDGNESFVNKAKLSLVKTGIDFDKDMVIDDTHCYNDYLIWFINEIRTYAKSLNKPIFIELVDFDIDADICVDINSRRDNKVDKNAIYFMNKSKKEIDISKLDIDLHSSVKQ
jgi:tRNA uridine 5-carbamoylmethylation protein Kti12